MATGVGEQLTNTDVVRLARVISSREMESIALGYLGIEEETIKNFKAEKRDDAEAFNRSVIRRWAYKNSGPSQKQVISRNRFDTNFSVVDPDFSTPRVAASTYCCTIFFPENCIKIKEIVPYIVMLRDFCGKV